MSEESNKFLEEIRTQHATSTMIPTINHHPKIGVIVGPKSPYTQEPLVALLLSDGGLPTPPQSAGQIFEISPYYLLALAAQIQQLLDPSRQFQ